MHVDMINKKGIQSLSKTVFFRWSVDSIIFLLQKKVDGNSMTPL